MDIDVAALGGGGALWFDFNQGGEKTEDTGISPQISVKRERCSVEGYLYTSDQGATSGRHVLFVCVCVL